MGLQLLKMLRLLEQLDLRSLQCGLELKTTLSHIYIQALNFPMKLKFISHLRLHLRSLGLNGLCKKNCGIGQNKTADADEAWPAERGLQRIATKLLAPILARL
jgi:hypothetical protein